jgi:predicted metalloprotease with PDZ domain
MDSPLKYLLACLLAAALAASPIEAQTQSEPQPSAPAPAIPTPRDVAYPGILTLSVDATDIQRKIFRIRQSIPVSQAGPMTLLYAEWIPGNHAPRGPIYNYSGLTITANGKPVKWTRDPANVFAFHVDVPAGAKTLDVEAQFLTPIESAQGGTMVTPDMMRLNWYVAALYPAGHFGRRVNFDVSLKLPDDWDYATALETASKNGNTITFKTVNYETLIDSPLIAGRYMKKWDLDPGGRSRVTLNVMADQPDQLDATEAMIETHRTLVKQADKLYGARHYNHYDFLLSLSDTLAGAGIEHSRSSDNGVRSGYFKSWDTASISRDLLAHEYTHSWNGKYRRGADLWTANNNTPMRNSLLWVYEGQTQYWGYVLAARSGFLTKQQALDSFAATAATYDYRKGRDWRPLADTTMDPIIASRRSLPSRSWQRSEDYYSEGLLIWLDADTLIRERSGGKRSLDNFAKSFFGVNDGDWGTLTYTFKDIVAALNKVEPYDWDTFLRSRVDDVRPQAPLDGLARGGYRLVYGEEQTESAKGAEGRSKGADLTYSIGLSVNADGKVSSVQWDGPAFEAGLTTAATIISVNGQAFTADRLKEAVAATKGGGPTVDIVAKTGDSVRTISLAYHDGARYPRLERIAGTPDRLGDIFTAR